MKQNLLHLLCLGVHTSVSRTSSVVNKHGFLPVVIVGLQDIPVTCCAVSHLPDVRAVHFLISGDNTALSCCVVILVLIEFSLSANPMEFAICFL